ncbi:hypothetical protein PHSC3_000834 [Chlamydiales bacterium STE3]|nr:hypothetical protein PHSC3_000834 [Chlamydiales bacterium STE3]
MDEEQEIEMYGDPGIASKDAKVPKFLLLTYAILPIWGLFSLYAYWGGSSGWLDRGYWQQLQRAANTTSSEKNYIEIEALKEREEKRS